jgi:hypothetical protein
MQIYKWMLQEIRDTNNNYVRYVYTKDSGQIYPSQIVYTGNGGADGIFEIDFSKTSNTDTPTNYHPGFLVTTAYRITKITVSVNGTVVREYNLSYNTPGKAVVYPWDAPVCRRHRSRFRGEADVVRLAKPAELVENDPQRTFSRCLLSSGSVSSRQQNLVVSQLQDWRVRHMGKLAVVATIKTVAGQAR